MLLRLQMPPAAKLRASLGCAPTTGRPLHAEEEIQIKTGATLCSKNGSNNNNINRMLEPFCWSRCSSAARLMPLSLFPHARSYDDCIFFLLTASPCHHYMP